jgi:phosphatidylglycerol:prolipoprotein diacylglycerol transferase
MGIEINVDPNIAQLGPVLLTWHGVFTALGVLVGVWLAGRLASKVGVSEDAVYTMALYCVVGGIIGARLLFVMENWDRLGFARNPLAILAINEGGISVFGAVLGGILGGFIGTRIHKLPFAAIADVAVGPLFLGLGIGRIGDIINGEHLGLFAPGFPLGVIYTHPQSLDPRCRVPEGLSLAEAGCDPVHLAVGYEMLWNFLCAAILIWLLGRGLPRGAVFLWFVILYSIGRLWTTFFRTDSPIFVAGLTAPILLSILSILVAVPALLWLHNRPGGSSGPDAPSRQVSRARARRTRRSPSST